jgi:hypothetical protein
MRFDLISDKLHFLNVMKAFEIMVMGGRNNSAAGDAR